MKKNLVFGFFLLLGISLVTGCSFSSFDFFTGDTSKAVQKEVQSKKAPAESLETIEANVKDMTDQMVDKVNAGKWNDAITVGKAAYSATENYSALVTKDNVASSSFNSTKEKLYETLVDTYDYKNSIQGLNAEEKEMYISFARKHFDINPTDPFKKLALSKVLLDAGKIQEGFKLASEVYNSQTKTKEITENYAWALYLSGKKVDAYNIYKNFYLQSETLLQLFHSAVVIEEYDKLLGLILYEGCQKAGNNLMVLELNVNNQSAESYINTIMTKSKKAENRLLIGGFRIDSQYNLASIDKIIKAIVRANQGN